MTKVVWIFITMAMIAVEVKSASGKMLYTEQNIEIVKILGSLHSINNFVFLQSEKNSQMADAMKKLSDEKLFCSIVSPGEINEVLNNEKKQRRFFSYKIILMIKEAFNLTEIIEKVLFPEPIVWVVFDLTPVEIQKFYFPPNTKLFLVQSKSNKSHVYRVRGLKKGYKMMVEDFGIWSSGQPIDAPMDLNLEKIDFQNVSLTVMQHMPVNGSCFEVETLAVFKLRCCHNEIIEMISKLLNFSINVRRLEMNHPYFYENGSVTDVFLVLQKNEVDISGCSYLVNSERLALYDFAWPTFTPLSRMYVKTESNEGFWQAYLKPFRFTVLYAMLSWIIVSGLFVQIFRKLRSFDFKLKILSVLKTILTSLQIFCNQGLPRISIWCSERIIHLMTFLIVLLVYQAYSAQLISSLTVVAPKIPFLTFDEFLNDGSFMLMTLAKGFHKIVFDKYFQTYGGSEYLKKTNLPNNAGEAVIQLCEARTLTYIDFRQNVVQEVLSCDVTEIPKPVFSYHLGLGFPKNSPYSKFMRLQIRRIESGGFLNRMKAKMRFYEKVQDPNNGDFITVTISQVGFPFLVLGIGIIISMGMLAAEIYCRKNSSRRKTFQYDGVNSSFEKVTNKYFR